jgi:hypothetical protein
MPSTILPPRRLLEDLDELSEPGSGTRPIPRDEARTWPPVEDVDDDAPTWRPPA